MDASEKNSRVFEYIGTLFDLNLLLSEDDDRRTTAFIAADGPIDAAGRSGESNTAMGEFSSGSVHRCRRSSVVGNVGNVGN